MSFVSGMVAVIVGLLMIPCLYFIAIIGNDKDLPDDIALPLLAISGVVFTIGVLAMTGIAYSKLGLTDKTQALGLPEGSIRAVIALSLVVLFAVLTVFLYSNLSEAGKTQEVRELSPEQAVSLAGQLAPQQITVRGGDGSAFDRDSLLKEYAKQGGEIPRFTIKFEHANTTEAKNDLLPSAAVNLIRQKEREGFTIASIDSDPEVGNNADKFIAKYGVKLTISYVEPHNAAADDFARQLLVMIGTLVTSVASFFFGSKAGGSSVQATPTPTLRRIDPSSCIIDPAGDPVPFTIEGDSLNQLNTVKIVMGNSSIAGQNFTSNDSQGQFKLDLRGATAGTWDVIATDSFGKSVRLPAGLTLQAHAPNA